MPELDLDALERLWGGKRIRHIVRRQGNAESGLDAALDVIDTLLDLVREQKEQLAAKDAEIERLRAALGDWGEERRAADKLNVTRDSSGDVTSYYNEKGEVVTGVKDFGKAGL